MVSGIVWDREKKHEGGLLLGGVLECPLCPCWVLREIPLSDVGIVMLRLFEEFGRGGKASVWFADAWDSIDNELAESIILDEVK